MVCEGLPIRPGIVGYGKYGADIADMHADSGFFRRPTANRFGQGERGRAARGGVDDQVRLKRLLNSFDRFTPDRNNCRPIGRCNKLQSTAALTQRDVGVLLDASPHGEFDQRAGHGVDVPAQIALRKGIDTVTLKTKIKTGPKRHSAGRGEVLFEARERLTKRALATAEECVKLRGMWHPGPGVASAGRLSRSSMITCSK